jgi:septal ring factor EnvC (AmiA/AmiB activator)
MRAKSGSTGWRDLHSPYFFLTFQYLCAYVIFIQLNTAKADLTQREAALLELQAVVQETTAELEVFKGKTAKLQEEVVEAKEELERAKGEVVNTQQELERAKVEIVSVQQELEGARAETANAQQELLRTSAEFR